MSKNVVLLFAGQGAQQVGMGQELSGAYPQAGDVIQRADEALGKSLSKVMFEGPEEELTKTGWCQPALYTHGLASWAALQAQCPNLVPVAAAGLSLGEFTAYAAAGSFSESEGLSLVAQRGQFMDEACAATEGSMAAMIGGDEAAVRALAEKVGVDVANLNSPGQIVVSGSKEGITAAIAGAKDAGLRMGKELNVAGAYHSRLMSTAQDQLAPVLAATEVSMPTFPVIGNVEARAAKDADEIRSTLERQVTGSVRWVESMELLLEQGHESFIEFSPKPVFQGFMNRIRKGTEVISIGDPDSLAAAVEKLA